MSDQGAPAPGIWPEAEAFTFAESWDRAVARDPKALFLRYRAPDGTVAEWSYGAFDLCIDALAVRLAAAGVRPGLGQGVHMALANGPAFVAVWLATMRLGAVMVPSDPFGRAPELAGHIARTVPAVGFCSADRATVYRRAIAQATAAAPDSAAPGNSETAMSSAAPGASESGAGRAMHVVAVDEHAPHLDDLIGDSVSSVRGGGDSRGGNGTRGSSGRDDRGNRTGGSASRGAPAVASPRALRPDIGLRDTAAVMFTSGTTGRPKGVEITQANYAFCGKVMAERAAFDAGDRLLVVLPLFHGNAQYYSFAAAIHAGAAVVLQPNFSAGGFCEQATSARATAASLFAAPMRMILARGADGPALNLKHCWYAQNVNDEQYARLSELFGCLPRQLYGMTETLPAVLTEPREHPVPSSMGRQTPGCLVDIQDVTGAPVPDDTVGELVVGGERGITLFAGYLDDPATTERSFRGGWLLTGDRARRDAAGCHYFDGRHSEVLKVSGENVSIVAVEAVLAAHPDVLEAAVVGRPDPIRDEVPVGFVVARRPERPPSESDLLAWCGEHLGKAAMPRELTLLEELPRTSVGKIRKFLLANRAKAAT